MERNIKKEEALKILVARNDFVRGGQGVSPTKEEVLLAIDYAINLSKKSNMTPDNPLSSSEKQVWDELESELNQKD